MTLSEVSVVLGTFNGAKFLDAQLDSIFSQTLRPKEIVIGDDGSTDDTLLMIQGAAARTDIPIKLTVNQTRLGFSENFLATASRASGDYIAFCDQDDLWDSRKLELGVQALLDFDAVLCTHAVSHVDERGRRTIEVKQREPITIEPGEADPWGNFYGFTMVFPRWLLSKADQRLRGVDPFTPGAILSHDRWIYFLASISGRTVYLHTDLAAYRQHDGQLYGGSHHRTISQRIKHRVENGQALTLTLAGIAGQRAALLASHEDVQARQHSRSWRSWQKAMEASARLYNNDSVRRRIWNFLRSVASGVYRPVAAGGLGRRRLRHDFAIAVIPRWF